MLNVIGMFHEGELFDLVQNHQTGAAREFLTRREAIRYAGAMNALVGVEFKALVIRYADQEDACAVGEHDIRKSATKCGACGKELCDLCGSDSHAAHEGHDLNNPRYWGV